jgi:ATP-dependent Clp endopeptidase proteolytic subunit ClpP
MNTPPSNRQWFEVRAEAGDEAPVEIYIYDAIYDSGCEFWGGVCPTDFVAATSPYRNRDVTLRINSPGGSAFAGTAISNYLRSFPKLSAVVDGLAASAASIVFLAAPKERRTMGVGSFLMIHEPSGFAIGPAAVMEKMAADLRKISDEDAALYAKDSGQPVEKVKAWMAEETWFTAQDAKEAGFVSTVADTPAIESNFDLSKFRHPPAALQPNRITMNAPNVTACGCQSPAGRTSTKTNTAQEESDALKAERDALKAENDALKTENEKLKNSDSTSKKARAVAAVDAAIGTGALPSALREAMIARYEQDEEATITALGALRPPGPGVAPIRASASAAGTAGRQSLEERIAAEPNFRKRQQMRTENWNRLMVEPAA